MREAPATAFPWHAWDDAVFERARAEGKPVFLHIGGAWCHWCHVMDEGTYPHPRVAALLRDHFLAIRVDTDERPDLNERYNQGGWPTIAILDADGEVLYGRTYVPPQELVNLLASVVSSEGRWTVAAPRPVPAPAPVALADVHAEVGKAYDRYHGGFGEVEKFPHPGVCEWLLDLALQGDDASEARLRQTLDAMAGRGLYDPEEGGFFRYCTQDDWTVPHYEKMLEDHARLLPIYLRAHARWPSPLWDRAARASVSWALAHLWQPGGGFGGSQDADEGYYALPRAQRVAPPAVDPRTYAGWNGWMIAALVRAAAAWGRPGLLGLARRTGRFLAERLSPEGAVSRLPGGAAGLLEDQVGVAAGFAALAAVEGGPWAARAAAALAWARAHLGAPGGGLLDRIPGGRGRLNVSARPVHGNAQAASTARSLAALSGEESWSDLARACADAALAEAGPWGFMGAAAAGAVWSVARPTVLVKVCDAPALRDHALAHPSADVYTVPVGPEVTPPGTALACTASACARPARDREALEGAVRALLGPPRLPVTSPSS